MLRPVAMIGRIAIWKRRFMSGTRTTRMIRAVAVVSGLVHGVPDASAAVVIDGTRVVYPAAKREVTVNIRNAGSSPALVQSWLDAGDPDAKPGDSKVPFVLTPPLFRLDPTKSQSLRMVFTRDPLPADRESLFWLNVLEVPPRAASNPDLPNQLEMAFRHRMKVFFRPAGLKGSAADAPAQLTWNQVVKDGSLTGIQARNPTAFHVSLIVVTVTVGGQTVTAKSDMIGPFASSTFVVADPVRAPAAAVAVNYTFVNDFGGNVKATATASVQ
jgi:chaperone protein EcpD